MTGRMAGDVLAGIRDAVVRAPARASHGWRWRTTRAWTIFGAFIWVALATGFTGGAIGQMAVNMHVQGSLAAILGVMQAGPLLVAARWPLGAWRIMAAGMLIGGLMSDRFMPWAVTAWLAMVVMLFQLAVCYRRRTAAGAGLVTALVVLAPVLAGGTPLWFALILWGIIVVVLIFGDTVSGRRAAEANLAEQTELRRQDLARQAVLEERARIARELHDVVAHHMSVIALQSEAAPYKIPDLSGTGQQTFEVIRDAAREALVETRRVVGVLRDADESAERLPQPGLDRFEELVEGARRAGLTVESRVLGLPRPVADGVDLTAFRIIQEALSNAARYAPGATVRVEIRYGDDRLTVSVADDGAGTTPTSEVGGGHGLVGMRERVAMLGGSLSVGHVSEGGFAVRADLPYDQ